MAKVLRRRGHAGQTEADVACQGMEVETAPWFWAAAFGCRIGNVSSEPGQFADLRRLRGGQVKATQVPFRGVFSGRSAFVDL